MIHVALFPWFTMSALHCLTSPLLHCELSHSALCWLIDLLVRSFIDLIQWSIGPSIQFQYGFIFAFVNWFIGSPATCHGASNDSVIHWSTASDSLIDGSLLHHRPANGHGPPGHRATGPPGNRATGPPGHWPPSRQATTNHWPPAIKSLKYVGDSAETGALRTPAKD